MGNYKNKPRAIILAAGRGKRLLPFTNEVPKCLVHVGNFPILFYQLTTLAAFGIKDIVIVVGYQAEMIKEYTKKQFPHLKFQFVSNHAYASTNDIASFALAEEYCKNSFIQIDSDVLFHPAILQELLDYQKHSQTIIRPAFYFNEEEMKVSVSKNNTVTRISKSLKPEETDGEFMSISLFTRAFSAELFKIMKRLSPLHYSGDAMDLVVRENRAPLYAVYSRRPCIEIDFPEDLQEAEEKVLPNIISEF